MDSLHRPCGSSPPSPLKETAVLSLKPDLVFSEKLLEVMKKHPVEDGALRMSKTINPCHGSRDDSKNWPG